MPRLNGYQAAVMSRAAKYAAAILMKRPEDCDEELQRLTDNMTGHVEIEGETPLIERLTAILERDDEDTDETARLIFEALAK